MALILLCPETPASLPRFLFQRPLLQVRFGQQKRYQDWFQRQYLSTPDSQSLRCDLIRYICGVVHPSNEVLSSDILPRWAIIGWLLTTCTVRGGAVGPGYFPSGSGGEQARLLCYCQSPSLAPRRPRFQKPHGLRSRPLLLRPLTAMPLASALDTSLLQS